jgi:hypothetical protein
MTLVAGLEAAVLRAVGGEVAVAVQTFGATLASQARAAAPVGPPRRGQPHLRDAITWTPTGATSGTLRLPARALFTDSGTRPHTIRARTPAGLRFYSARAGHWVRLRQVRHPGTTGTHWVVRSIGPAQAAVTDPVLGAALATLARLAMADAGLSV